MNRDEPGMYKSYIVFGNRATLKKIHVVEEEVKVIRRSQLLKELKEDVLRSERIFTTNEVDQIHHELKRYYARVNHDSSFANSLA